jgi:hypothetical protein
LPFPPLYCSIAPDRPPAINGKDAGRWSPFHFPSFHSLLLFKLEPELLLPPLPSFRQKIFQFCYCLVYCLFIVCCLCLTHRYRACFVWAPHWRCLGRACFRRGLYPACRGRQVASPLCIISFEPITLHDKTMFTISVAMH